MRLHRFIIDQTLSHYLQVEDDIFLHQWLNVLRLKPKDQVTLCDGKGKEAEYELVECTKKRISCQQLSEIRTSSTPNRSIILCVALIKHEHFDLMVEKVVELGVTRIIPIVTERTIKSRFNKPRLERIIREATEQSDRTWLATIEEVKTYEEVVNELTVPSRWFCDTEGELVAKSLSSSKKSSDIALLVGPEGGWTEAERRLAKTHSWQSIQLSENTLRAETAAIVAVAMAAIRQ